MARELDSDGHPGIPSSGSGPAAPPGSKHPTSRPAEGIIPLAIVCVALIAATVGVYHRVGTFAFVFDDQGFLHDNPTVLKGLSGEGLRWALTSLATGNWHPLTWLSHMLDIQLFGLRPGPHHLVNLFFHALNTLLLFLVLRRLAGALWPAAFVAALFAIHPLHVESVAWIAERKDLLSGLFWILSLGAYVRYAASPGVLRYVLVLALFTLGLLSKPMIVTLPVVLLLLDWWPLGRLRPTLATGRTWVGLVREKLPLIVLAGAVALVTARAQQAVGAMASNAVYQPAARLANAVVVYAIYLGKVFWPTGLAAYYPFPLDGWRAWQFGGALLLLIALSAAALAARKRCPGLAVGWFWYLISLAPVIGLVQVGGQARADRYLYLPLIGLGLAAAWCAPAWLRRARLAGAPVAAIALLGLAGLAYAANRQSETWRTPLSLYARMLEVTSGNWVAHSGYAVELEKQGRLQEAIEHYRAAAAINHGSVQLRGNLAFALDDAGLADEAVEQLRILLRMTPGNAEAHYRLGMRLGRAGRFAEALPELREATRLRPWFPPGWFALGATAANLGRRPEATAAFREVLRIDPGNQEARRYLELLQAPQQGFPQAGGN